MKPKPSRILAQLTLLGACLAPQLVWAWGDYGHQQISDAALKLLSDESLKVTRPSVARCMAANRAALLRVVISPDTDWKHGPKGFALNEDALHFFHLDAFDLRFAQNASHKTDALPMGEYSDAQSRLLEMISSPEQSSYIAKNNPSMRDRAGRPATVAELADNGSAPWRVLQLARIGADALRAGDLRKGMVALGALSHYVGDIAQPFHVAADFDGYSAQSPARGVHSVFESGMLSAAAAAAGVKPVVPGLKSEWDDFRATEVGVLAAGRADLASNPEPLVNRAIVPRMVELAAESLGLVQSIRGNFAAACAAETHAAAETPAPMPATSPSPDQAPSPAQEAAAPAGPHCSAQGPKLSKPFVAQFVASPVAAAKGAKVFDVGLERMGRSAALVARIWAAAWAGADLPADGCTVIKLTREEIIQLYDEPSYLGNLQPAPATAHDHSDEQ